MADNPAPSTASANPAALPSRRRLVATGTAALLACAAMIAAAIWLLVTPGGSPETADAGTASAEPAVSGTVGTSPDAGQLEGPTPSAQGSGDVESSEVEVALQWVRTLVGWAPQEQDAAAARSRAQELAPGAEVDIVAGAVLDHAAALSAGAPTPNEVAVVDVTDPQIWPAGWVVVEVTVTTAGSPEVGVSAMALHVTCEVEVSGGQVSAALIGDGAAWIEYLP
ncbi:hypothetical protein [Cellulomonas sp. RIT-PI-Y]|uniref:hypothetical protein n=1 Tax=Cellulomonas sp. RIT-PI-Y TaxID=3035297 RepID=UPI0021D8416C|nr:hypothetical protein [Cellulomonas sp. RIT-PI-Y]